MAELLITHASAYEFRLVEAEKQERKCRRVVIRITGQISAAAPIGSQFGDVHANCREVTRSVDFDARVQDWGWINSALGVLHGARVQADDDVGPNESVESLVQELKRQVEKNCSEFGERAGDSDVLSGLVGGLQRLLLDAIHAKEKRSSEEVRWVDMSRAVHRLTRAVDLPASEPPLTSADNFVVNTYNLSTVPEKYPSNFLLQRAALGFGLDTVRTSGSTFVANHPHLRRAVGFTHNMGAWTGYSSYSLTYDKRQTRSMLRRAGVPVSRGRAFRPAQTEKAVEFAKSIAAPVVVKPRAGSKGIGVSTDLRTEADIRRAILALEATSYAGRDFIIEKFVTGNDYRVHVIGDRVVSVMMRRPASVVGDGRSTVTELVLAKNRVRLQHPQMRSALIPLGDQAAYWLERQGLSTSSIPDEGSIIQLGSSANVTSGGDSIEVLDETHPSMLRVAVHAVQVFPGLDHAGIDLIGDHRVDAAEKETTVLEVNGSPITLLHHFPLYGPQRDVAAELVRRACELSGYLPDRQQATLCLRVEVFGHVQGVGYRAWLAGQARRLGIAGWVRNTDSRSVEAEILGGRDESAMLASMAFAGPSRAAVTSVTTSHVEPVGQSSGFEVR